MNELRIWKDDPWLEPWKRIIWGRYSKSILKRAEISGYGKTLCESVNSHLYYGVTSDEDGGWVFREWAPGATAIFLIGEFNSWSRDERYRLNNIGGGNWELKLSSGQIKHGDLFKWLICWNSGEGERIPAYARRTVQDPDTKLFAAQVWNPEPYKWRFNRVKKVKNPLIYEAHIGMST
ncbi:MAG: 1,4-alpha-glucan-branching enzyme, partial [Bacteroidales bacterium]|nr:1,4-alpha-glucan-branching enzyme [Bacteroidales bacterium]